MTGIQTCALHADGFPRRSLRHRHRLLRAGRIRARRRAALGICARLVGPPAQALLALQDPALNGTQGIELLLERLLALVALLVRALALACQAFAFARGAAPLRYLGRKQRGEAADARHAGVGDRLEQLRRARIVS